jgi:histidinol-phosphate/aromatic aminotransferase/cobyric acid decarboxylase-like protein/choline kinase
VNASTDKMQAIILAAGRGMRLGPITDKVPKVLVEVNNVPFIINQLDALTKHPEIEEVIIVVGYKKELIKEKISNNYKGMRILFVDNDRWAETNNIYSLWLACNVVKHDFILMEGDIFFEPRLLNPLFENKGKNVVLLSKYKPSMSGTVVKINEKTGKIEQLISSRDQDENFDFTQAYKTINIYSFTYDFFEQFLFPSISLYVRSHVKDYWELVLGVLIYLHVENIVPYIIDDDVNWYEVDDQNDLNIANYVFADANTRIEMLSNAYGGLWRYDVLDFCYLVNPYFPPKTMIDELSQDLPKLIQNYPSCQKDICRLLSRWFKDDVNAENLVVGNGACELIRILNRHIIKKVLIPIPTFNEYEDVEKENQSYFPLKETENFSLDPDRFIDSAKKNKVNFAVLVNPNNPTGNLYPEDDVIKILDNLRFLDGIVVDESFMGFTGNRKENSVQSLINDYPNLIIIHSIGKEYGVLGLRLGYLLTENEHVLKTLRYHLPIWNINSVAEKFLELFPKYASDFEESLITIVKEREWLYSELKKIDWLHVYESHANFFLAKINNIRSNDFCRYLFEKKIYLKNCSNKSCLGRSFVRIALRSRPDNEILLNAIAQLNKGT